MNASAYSKAFNYKVLRDELTATANRSDDEELFKAIVNAPFSYKVAAASLFLGITVLLLVNKQDQTIDRVALADTEFAKNTTRVSVIPFEEIRIPLDHTDNIIAKAISTGETQDTTDWKYIFTPVLTSDQARINQASAGIAYSAVCPIKARDGGAMIFSFYQYQGAIGKDQREFMNQYCQIVSDCL